MLTLFRQSFAPLSRRVLMVCALVSLAAGCASVPSAGLGDNQAEIPDNAGLVALQVVSNASRLSSAISQWGQVLVLRVSDRELYTIPATGRGFSTTRAFVGALAPGEYIVAGLYARRVLGDTTYTMSARVPLVVGRFEVQTDRLTNLGTLVFQPFSEASVRGDDVAYLVSRTADTADLSELVRSEFPSEYGQLSDPEPIGWLDDTFGELRQTVSDRVRTFALATIVEPEPDSSGFWLLGRFGQIYRRDAQGDWSRSGADTPYQFTAATRLADGTALVGGERGRLFARSEGSGVWVRQSFPIIDSTIVELGQFDSGEIFALAEVSDAFVLMQQADGTSWRQVASFPKQKPGWLAEIYDIYTVSLPYVVRKGDQLDVWMDKKKHRYDVRTGETSTQPAIEFSRLVVQRNGLIVGREYSSWSGEKEPQYSSDGGQTWITVKMGEGMFTISDGMPFVFTNGRLLKTGGRSAFGFGGSKDKDPVPLLQSTNRGQSWIEIGNLPKGCDRLSQDASTDALLFTVCLDGRVLSSRDGGREWDHEFGDAPTEGDFPEVFAAE